MTIDPTVAGAGEIAGAIRRREISSEEVLDALLARVGEVNPVVNAVVTLDEERARAACRAADAATIAAADEPGAWAGLGALHGVPMTIKDVWETEGLRSTAGAPSLADHVPDRDAIGVARLRTAGAIVFGKTNTPIWAGDMQTFNEVFGLTRNPWDPDRTTSGSSGGAAAALASGMTPLELGSDIGGSIRTPSSACGVFGLKPTWGIIPNRGYLPYPPGNVVDPDVNCPGPMARSVADLCLGLDVLAGPIADDAIAWRLELPEAGAPGSWSPNDPGRAVSAPLAGLRVALVADDERFRVAAEVSSTIRAYAAQLVEAGAIVDEVPLPVSLTDGFRSWQDLVLPEVGLTLPPDVYESFTAFDAFDPGDDIALRSGRSLVLRWKDHHDADERRQQQRRMWAEHFGRYDVVVAPAMPVAPYPHDVDRDLPERTIEIDGVTVSHLELTVWPGAIGAMLLPVVALPAGRTPGGLPVGIQLIGPHLRDRWLLSVATALTATTPTAFSLPPPMGA